GACGIFSRRGWVFQFLQINHDHPPFNLIGGLDSASEPITSRTHTTAAAPSGKSIPKTTLAGSWLGKSVWGSQGSWKIASSVPAPSSSWNVAASQAIVLVLGSG